MAAPLSPDPDQAATQVSLGAEESITKQTTISRTASQLSTASAGSPPSARSSKKLNKGAGWAQRKAQKEALKDHMTPANFRFKHTVSKAPKLVKIDCLWEDPKTHEVHQIDTSEEERKKAEKDRESEWYYQKPGKKNRRILFFDGKLKRLSEIDTAAETFRAVFHYYLTWLATEKEVREYFENKNSPNPEEKWEPSFMPILDMSNFVDGSHEPYDGLKLQEGFKFKNGTKTPCKYGFDPMQTSWDIPLEAIGFDPRKAYWFRQQFNVDCIFAEELELEFFPFDCQDFGIHLLAPGKTNKFDVLPMPRCGSFFNVDAKYSMVSEWLILGVVVEFGYTGMSKTGQPYPGLSMRIKAERKWHTHVANILVTFCMFPLGVGMFAIPLENVGERLGYAVTLVLADVATLQLMFDSMPNIPYETFMDSYTYGCFVFLVILTLWSCVTGFNGEGVFGAENSNVDFVGFCGFCGLAIIVHIFFLVRLKYRRNEERTKLWMTGAQVEAYFEEQEADSVTVVPHCECNWDPDKMCVGRTNNEIWAKDFPDQTKEDKHEQEELEGRMEDTILKKATQGPDDGVAAMDTITGGTGTLVDDPNRTLQ